MIVIISALLGALWGVRFARKQGGKGWDLAQYAAGYAIAFTIVGLLITILIHRAAM